MINDTIIKLARAITTNWIEENRDMNRESSTFACMFCDANWTKEHFWYMDEKYYHEMIRSIDHDDNCPYLLAKKTLKDMI